MGGRICLLTSKGLPGTPGGPPYWRPACSLRWYATQTSPYTGRSCSYSPADLCRSYLLRPWSPEGPRLVGRPRVHELAERFRGNGHSDGAWDSRHHGRV